MAERDSLAEQTNNVQWRLGSLERRVEAMEHRTELLAELRFEVAELKKDVEKILKTELERDRAERVRREQQARDRKADRKWQLTVMAAWASAIVAALAIIVPLLVS